LVTYSIGRDEGNDIVVEDLSVSRRHARIEELGDGQYMVVDLGSANGCYVEQSDDWQQFAEAEVMATETIMLGEYRTTARDLIRRVAKPRPPGETVIASAEETQRNFDRGPAETVPPQETLGSVWTRFPQYQKISAVVVAAVLGLLIIAAITIGFLGGLKVG
jgi:predicted component of type VI protein secretion system